MLGNGAVDVGDSHFDGETEEFGEVVIAQLDSLVGADRGAGWGGGRDEVTVIESEADFDSGLASRVEDLVSGEVFDLHGRCSNRHERAAWLQTVSSLAFAIRSVQAVTVVFWRW